MEELSAALGHSLTLLMNDPFGEERLYILLGLLLLTSVGIFAWTQFVLSVIIKGVQ